MGYKHGRIFILLYAKKKTPIRRLCRTSVGALAREQLNVVNGNAWIVVASVCRFAGFKHEHLTTGRDVNV